jgi:hypothetical protein
MQARAGQPWALVEMFIALLRAPPILGQETGGTRESSESGRPAEDVKPPPAMPYRAIRAFSEAPT